MSLLRQRFGRSLLNIFNHYVDMATRRRAQEEVADRERVAAQLRRLAEQGRGQDALAQDKVRQHKETEKKMHAHVHHRGHMDSPGGAGGTGTTTSAASCSPARSHTIGHKEFFQFCQDFKLKSSALLSAIQVGEVYLTAAPLDGGEVAGDDAGDVGILRAGENEANNGQQLQMRGGAGDSGRSAADRILAAQRNRYMDFDRFLRSILLMSLLSYRGVHSRVLPVEKTKALLLYMWRAINSREKTEQAVNSRYGASKLVEGHAGSLNVHGSGMFSVTLQEMWKEDGFSSYVTKSDQRASVNNWGTTTASGSSATNGSNTTDSAGGTTSSDGPMAVDTDEDVDADGMPRTSWRRSARLMQMGGGGGGGSSGSPVPSSVSPAGKATAKRRTPGSPSTPSKRGGGPPASSGAAADAAADASEESDPLGCAEIMALSGLSTSLESMHLSAAPRTPSVPASSPWGRKAGPGALRGVELGELFRRRPELAEFMYLELLSSSASSTTAASAF
jgi:hypothetical protein